MLIDLRNNSSKRIDLLHPPENLEEIIKQDFAAYTRGTSDGYRHDDQLTYLDLLRKALHPGEPEEKVTELIMTATEDNLIDQGYIPDASDYHSIEFLAYCFHEGFKPFHFYDEYESDGNNRIESLTIFRIIKAVVNYDKNEGEEG